MSDIRTAMVDGQGAWALSGGALVEDNGLETAVVLSLFTDRLASAAEAPGSEPGARRGWWADVVLDVVGDLMGSRLWLLQREKQTPEVLARAEAYAREALQWLLDDGVAERIDLAASWLRQGVMALDVTIARSRTPVVRYRFEDFWKGH